MKLFLLIVFLLLNLRVAIANDLFSDSHDITSLPVWGPYSKQYYGATHIDDIASGRAVDFTVMPGLFNRTVSVPNALFESRDGCYPWNFPSDLSSWTYRYEIEWKDKVYTDVTYHRVADDKVLVEIHFVNATPLPQNVAFHTMASVRYAEDYPLVTTDAAYVPAMRYKSYEPAHMKHNYSLVYDGWLRGESRDAQSLTGSVMELSGDIGDKVVLTLPESHPENMLMRIKTKSGAQIRMDVNGQNIDIRGTGEYELIPIKSKSSELVLRALSNGKAWIDAILLSSNAVMRPMVLNYVPEIEKGDGWYCIKYDDVNVCYGVVTELSTTQICEYFDKQVDISVRRSNYSHNHSQFYGDEKGHYTSCFQGPICLKANSDTTVFNLIVSGTKEKVINELKSFSNSHDSYLSLRQSEADTMRLLKGAEKYSMGARIIQSALFNNIVYPVWTQNQYIRHFTPGKNWNSLYTWDSGFISLALSEINALQAFENIRAYTTDASSQSAFIHHGTPLPIQFLAFKNLCDKSCSDEEIRFMYPRLMRYYNFMVGHSPSSTTRMPNGLLRTWDYFYNSGGWDDYPPQLELLHNQELYPYVAPMVQTSFYIRAAKILRLMAHHLGYKKDVKLLTQDINAMAKAIQTSAWDEESGYFGYVKYNQNGKVEGIYRWKDGKTNYNMGLDGVSPLVAGVCSASQQQILIDNIFNSERLWTPVGISAVDQSAPYFSNSGYWNGSVWMPHQFVLWKTMLDMGRPDLAEKIAYTALDTWEKEVEASYRSLEHFMIAGGRGKGWHDFSGLSSPILNWYCSYYRLGTVTAGFDVMLSHARMLENCTRYDAVLETDTDCIGKEKTIVLCMAPGRMYRAIINGKNTEIVSPRDGLLYLTFAPESKISKLTVTVSR